MGRELFGKEGERSFHLGFSQKIYSGFKRLIDLGLSAILLILLLPVFLVVALLIKCTSKGPVIFKQQRVGRYGKTFTIFKFRTMYVTAPKNVATQDLFDSDSHLTKVGKVLRKTSIDELPQVFNVLLGNMSLIGPRPLVVTEKHMHEMRFASGVYNVRPGITGLAQINGRDHVTGNAKIKYDSEYIRNYGLLQDLKILCKSVYVVLNRKGVAEGGAARQEQQEMPEELQHTHLPRTVLDRKKVG